MHKFYSYISKFACIKFQTNVKRFCYIIAIYFSGHSVHTVLACVQIYEESATYFWNMYLPNAGASHINKKDVMHGIIISAYGGPQVPHYFWIKHAQQHELGKLLYVKKYCVVRQQILCCGMSHNTILFHADLQQFSQFVLLDMFDSKVVWHLWATIPMPT